MAQRFNRVEFLNCLEEGIASSDEDEAPNLSDIEAESSDEEDDQIHLDLLESTESDDSRSSYNEIFNHHEDVDDEQEKQVETSCLLSLVSISAVENLQTKISVTTSSVASVSSTVAEKASVFKAKSNSSSKTINKIKKKKNKHII